MENANSLTMKVILCILLSNFVNWNICNLYRLQQILLQLEEEQLRNDSADAAMEGTAPKPKKTIGEIKVQGIVASGSFHGYFVLTWYGCINNKYNWFVFIPYFLNGTYLVLLER